MDYIQKYNKWIDNNIIDNISKNELLSINDNNEIKDRFYKDLEFGTGGMRGVMGIGTNRINVYTIRKATQGLVNYININNSNKIHKSVAIAYDSRNYSDIFAEEAALVLAANNIKVYVFDSLRPTPELSFAVRYLNCMVGIVITASHNPSNYNGYKVYNSDGGQITLDMANSIISQINKLNIFEDIKICTKKYAISKNLLSYIGEDVDKEYLDNILELSIKPNLFRSINNFRIVYTPLHGAGLVPIKKILLMLGCKDVHIVSSQELPDGDFPSVKSPNPEEREALAEGIKLAKNIKADIVLGTDPDSDRVGVAIKNKDGNYKLLTGNQIGALLTYYLVSNKKCNSNDVVIKTIVTSELGANIAKDYGLTVCETLTGFKFIGEKIKEFEDTKNYNFLFGYEESYGYLAGTFVRDKDAVIASMLIVEMAAFYKLQGFTLIDVINKLYKKYGYYVDLLDSFCFESVKGKCKINSIVDKFRDIKKIKNVLPDVQVVEDYKLLERFSIAENIKEEIKLPSSNVIKLYLSNQSWFAVRPSGTEPKLKIYYSSVGSTLDDANVKLEILRNKVLEVIEG